MGGQIALPILLVLLCASTGWTQTSYYNSSGNVSTITPRTETSYYNSSGNAFSVSPSSNTTAYKCTKRDGTSLTVLLDAYLIYTSTSYYLQQVLNHLSARFPCVTRQYASILLDYDVMNTTITSDKDVFLRSIAANNWDSYYGPYTHLLNCSQSFFHGLKKALEISPTESVIVVVTAGSMADYDTQLLSDVYTLLEKKKSQLHFLWNSGYCSMNSSQQDIFNQLAFFSFGEIVNTGYISYFKFIKSMELLLSKPLNSSVRVLYLKTNVTYKYTKTFNITNSFKYLLIAGDKTFTLNFTNPNGNKLIFTKFSSIYYYYYTQDLINYHLIKSPAIGIWTLNVQGNGSLTVQILGFTGLNNSGNCSDSDCHPNATCGEFGGAQQCTCKEGFAGDGYNCEDIDECQDYYNNNCNSYSGGYCMNTIGSYTCSCYYGNVYMKDYGCVDVDRCADSSLNDCHPLAVCTNYYYGYYTCSCPYGYYGDGRYCEVNECQQGSPCGSNECMKYNGSYACVDPCYNYTVLNDSWRSTSNVYDYYNSYNYYYYYYYDIHCDSSLNGWYRLKGEYGQQMPEYCVPSYSCGTHAPMWLNGSHPNITDGVVNRTACANWNGDCCLWYNTISVKKCYGGYYVYKFQGTPACNLAYCIESNYTCSSTNCAPDESCRVVDGVKGCQCKNSSYQYDWIQPANLGDYVKPEVTCNLDTIEVKFSKCLLENLGYNTSSMHLRDDYCQGIYSKKDKAYITFVSQPKNGSCGGNISSTQNTITYSNTVYLTARTDGGKIRKPYNINFYCSYPLSMDINLVTSINSLTAAVTINVFGTSNYTITMGLFQDSGYTNPYSGSEVWLDSSSVLYVGVIATGSSGASPFVLLLKNCYATTTANDTYGMRYNIIQDRCPNKNDPTISVLENGASLKGRFAFQVFKFLGGLDQVYLHCEVGLCDTSSSDCSAGCSLMRSVDVTAGTSQTISLGPIKYKAASTSAAVTIPTGGGNTLPASKLFMSAIVFLLILALL